MTNINKRIRTNLLLTILFSKIWHKRKAMKCYWELHLEVFELTCLSIKQYNTSLSEVIAAKINSLQAVCISIDNKLDGLDARVSKLGSPDGNTDQNTEWLEGMVKNTGTRRLYLFLLQSHQRQKSLSFGKKSRQKKLQRVLPTFFSFFHSTAIFTDSKIKHRQYPALCIAF